MSNKRSKGTESLSRIEDTALLNKCGKSKPKDSGSTQEGSSQSEVETKLNSDLHKIKLQNTPKLISESQTLQKELEPSISFAAHEEDNSRSALSDNTTSAPELQSPVEQIRIISPREIDYSSSTNQTATAVQNLDISEHKDLNSLVSELPNKRFSSEISTSNNNIQEIQNPHKKRGFSFNIWKIICLGILIGVLGTYMVAESWRIFNFVQKKQPELSPFTSFVQSFEGMDKGAKEEALEYLLSNYEDMIDKSKVSIRSRNSTSNKWLTGPLLGKENDFTHINSIYQSDEGVKMAMTTDNLTQLFYCMAYAPKGVIEPKCDVTERDVLLDVARMAKITNRIRTYGMQCNQADHILKAIKDLDVNMSLSLGVWIGEDDYVNSHEIQNMKVILNKYPRNMFDSIFVGNEVLYRGDKNPAELITIIRKVKNYLHTIGYDDLPVGTSELGSLVNKDIIDATDFIAVNIHPFFGGINVESAKDWVNEYMSQEVLPLIEGGTNKSVVISEIGWPYSGGSYEKSIAAPKEMETFIQSWVCQNNQTSYYYIYFEAFDEPWKSVFYEDSKEWETEWGFFSEDRKVKDSLTGKCKKI